MPSQVKYGLKTKVMTMERFVGLEKRENVIGYVASQTYGLNVSSTKQISALTSTSRIKLTALSDEPKEMSGKIIGLSIGLPIGIFCFGLMIFLIYFYFIKNSIFLSVQPVSPKESIKGSESTWLNRFFNFDCFHKSKNDDDIENNYGVNSLEWSNNHAIESTIQYKIGINPCNSKGYENFHIRTPKDVYRKYPRIKPQPLEKISSLNFSENRLSFASDASTDVKNSNKGINDGYDYTYVDDSIYKKNKGKENFTSKFVSSSPLDKRTNRSSVYQRINDLIPRLTPTIQLKNLNILNRLDKNYAEQPVGYENERSPILEKSHHVNFEDVDAHDTRNLYTESCDLPSLLNANISKKEQVESRYSSINHLIERQVLENNKTNRRSDIIIEPVPFKTKTSKKPKIEILPNENEVHVKSGHSFLDKENSKEDDKHNTKLTVGRVYPVIRPYIPQLTDEISLSIGEYVRVLMVHDDDRWCLVEKCTMDGTSKSLINFGDQMRNNRKYLNDDRGIIPGECILKGDFV